MRIGFLRAYDPKSPYQWSLPPLGIGYLAAYVARETPGHEFVFEMKFDDLMAHKPDLLAISTASENFTQAVNFARLAREEFGIPVIAGGMHVTSLPHTLPKVFDAGAVGEGERTFLQLVNLYAAKRRPDPADFAKIPGICYHDNGAVAVTEEAQQLGSMDELPYPNRPLLRESWAIPIDKQVHLISSRGCPYKCSFCSSGLHWKTYRWFSAEYTVNEIEYLREKYDPEEFYFFDDLFIANSRRFKEICRLLRERRLLDGIRFRCYGRVDLIKEPMADLLADHNFQLVDFGFESNDPDTLKFLNKTYASPEVNQRCVDLLAERGISIGANFIIGNPGEDDERMQRTMDFALRNEPYFDRMSVGPLQPLPGTGVWHYAVGKGIASEDMDWSRLAYYEENFDIHRFPYMSDVMTREHFLTWLEKFQVVQRRVNMAGQIRGLQRELAARDAELRQAQSAVETYEGSRLVRAALKLRQARQRIGGALGFNTRPAAQNGHKAPSDATPPATSETAPPPRERPSPADIVTSAPPMKH